MTKDRQILEEYIPLPVTPSMSAELYRFSPRSGEVLGTVLMLPGFACNETVFARKDKSHGLALFLARQGYEVFIGLHRGREASCRLLRRETFGLKQVIMEDLPLIWRGVRKRQRSDQTFVVTHREAGMLFSAFLLRHEVIVDDIRAMVFFDAARQIHYTGWRKRFLNSPLESFWLRGLARILGVVPSASFSRRKKSEPATLLVDVRSWQNGPEWQGVWDNFDYHSVDISFPPCLYLVSDYPQWIRRDQDTRSLMQELPAHHGRMVRLSKRSGNLKNYPADELCRDPIAEKDYFPMLTAWLEEHSGKADAIES